MEHLDICELLKNLWGSHLFVSDDMMVVSLHGDGLGQLPFRMFIQLQ